MNRWRTLHNSDQEGYFQNIVSDLHRIDLGDLGEPDLVAFRTFAARVSSRNLSGVGKIDIKLYDIEVRYLRDKNSKEDEHLLARGAIFER